MKVYKIFSMFCDLLFKITISSVITFSMVNFFNCPHCIQRSSLIIYILLSGGQKRGREGRNNRVKADFLLE